MINRMNFVSIALVTLTLGVLCGAQLPKIEQMCVKTPKNCLTLPSGCATKGTCKGAAYFDKTESDSDGVKFNFQTATLTSDFDYVSLGFSSDVKMGHEITADCIADRKGTVVGANTDGHHHEIADEEEFDNFKSVAKIEEDATLSCTFTIQGEVTYSTEMVALNDTQYYFMLAIGKTKDDGSLDHHVDRIVSEDKISINDKPTNTKPNSAALTHLTTAMLIIVLLSRLF